MPKLPLLADSRPGAWRACSMSITDRVSAERVDGAYFERTDHEIDIQWT